MTKRIISLSGPVNRERGETREHPVEFLGCPAPVEGAPRTGIVPRQPGSRQRRKQFQKCAQEGNEEQKTLRVGGSPPTLTTGSDLPLGPRLWRFIKKKELYARHYDTFEAFRGAIDGCLSKIPTEHAKELKSLMTHKFQTFQKVSFLAA